MKTTEFNSLGDVIQYFLKMNANAIEILSTLAKSVTANQDTVSITNIDANGTERVFSIPSYSYFSKRIIELSNDIEKLYQIKDKELGNPIFSKYLISENDALKDVTVPSTFYAKPNFILENLLNPLLYVKIDLTDKITSDVSKMIVRRLLLNLDSEVKLSVFNNNFNKINNLIYDDVIAQLNENGISYIIDDDVRELSYTTLKYSGGYDIIKIYGDTINGKYAICRKVLMSTLTYTDNINGVTRQLAVGDILLSIDGDTEFEILDLDFTTNTATLGRKSGYDVLTIGTNILKIATEPIGTKILEIPMSYNDYQIIFTKFVDPYFQTISSKWDLGFGVSSSDLIINTDDGNMSFDEYYKSFVTDYGRVLNELAKQTNINPDTTSSILRTLIGNEIVDDNNLSIDPPIIEEKSFKIVDLNEKLMDVNLTNRAKKALTDKTNKEQLKNTLDNEIESLNTLITEEIQKTSPNIANINSWKESKTNKELEKIAIIKEINDILSDIKNFTSTSNISSTPFPVIIGAVELPTIPDATQPSDLFDCYLEYRYRFLTADKAAANSYSLNLGSGTVTTSYWQHIFGPKMRRTISNNEYVYQQLDNLNPDVVSVNEIQVPLYNIEPGYVEIQVRFAYRLTPIVSIKTTEWSSSIFVDYSSFVKSYSSSTMALLSKEIYTADITKKYDDLESIISNLSERLEILENIKTTNSYQYKEYIVLSDYNIQSKSFELSKVPQTSNLIMQLIGGQPISPDEYTIYYKKITWGDTSVMNSFTTGDTLVIEYII